MRRKGVFLLKIFISISLITFLYKTNRDAFEDAFFLFTPSFIPFFMLSGCFFMLNIVLLASRQLLLLAPMKITSSFKDMFRFAYAGMFANMFLPTGLGYDAVRIIHFKSHFSLSLVIGWILTDRIIGFIGIIILSIITINVSLFLSNTSETYILLLDIVAVFILALSMILIASRTGTGVLMYCLRKIPKLLENQKISSFMEGLSRYSDNRSKLFYAILLSVASTSMAILGLCILGYALGGIKMAFAVMLYAPVVMLSSIIPVSPGNLGWTEAAAAGVCYAFGSDGGLSVFILWRIVNITFSLGGLPTVLNILKTNPST